MLCYLKMQAGKKQATASKHIAIQHKAYTSISFSAHPEIDQLINQLLSLLKCYTQQDCNKSSVNIYRHHPCNNQRLLKVYATHLQLTVKIIYKL